MTKVQDDVNVNTALVRVFWDTQRLPLVGALVLASDVVSLVLLRPMHLVQILAR